LRIPAAAKQQDGPAKSSWHMWQLERQ
jgi:hypothetical protein